ncbi:MAG: ExbD/TolR family protein [Pseudomonadales bacterium]
MNFRRSREREAAWIDLAPLIDVVFLLLIFFMVSTTFVRESRLHIDLPTVGSARPSNDLPVLEIVVDAGGLYHVNGVPVADAKALTRQLRALAVTDEQRVLVTADARTAHQSVVSALSAAADAGLVRVGIATRPTDEY